ncbi:hypothetical protein CDD83_11124 [Cordyceps sp. RAO-2017]|nr:hypothetical protein CDD83_11124 [Cordyceps sp. RAO-2017]
MDRIEVYLVTTSLNHRVRTEIFQKSSGIFLWVVLVLDILNSEDAHGTDRIQKMRERLKEMPPKLNGLSASNGSSSPPACFIRRSFISLSSWAVTGSAQVSGIETTWDSATMENSVRSYTKGLAEVTRNQARQVQVIHESVRDFLLGKYGTQWAPVSANLVGHCHDLLRNSCLSQITNWADSRPTMPAPGYEISASVSKDEKLNAIRHEYPFLGYAVSHLLRHWVHASNLFERFAIRRYSKSVGLLHTCAERNLADLSRIHPERNHCFGLVGKRYGATILAAQARGSREAVFALVNAQVETTSPTCLLRELCEEYCKDWRQSWPHRRDLNLSRRARTIYGFEDAVRIPLDRGADMEARDHQGLSPLLFAILPGHEATVRVLLDRGANIEARDSGAVTGNGRTLLWLCAEQGPGDAIKALLDRGADIGAKNNEGQSPLFFAVQSGREALVGILLDRGADIEARDSTGRSPLSIPIELQREAILKLLLEHGADVSSRALVNGQTPLSRAIGIRTIEMVKLLLKHGADANCRDHNDLTPLFRAVEIGTTEMVKLLLKYGADANFRDHNDLTPLLRAAVRGATDIAELLLKRGADFDSRDHHDQTPLSRAAVEGSTDMVELLLEHGADINPREYRGQTPLLRAAAAGTTETVKLLLEHGADVSSRDCDGRTSLSFAVEGRRVGIARMLERAEHQLENALPHPRRMLMVSTNSETTVGKEDPVEGERSYNTMQATRDKAIVEYKTPTVHVVPEHLNCVDAAYQPKK